MSIWDIINPWGALRRERRLFVQTVADYEAERALSAQSLREAHEYARGFEDIIHRLRKRGAELQARIAKAHFRNPETGRIGPVGKVYE